LIQQLLILLDQCENIKEVPEIISHELSHYIQTQTVEYTYNKTVSRCLQFEQQVYVILKKVI